MPITILEKKLKSDVGDSDKEPGKHYFPRNRAKASSLFLF
jgi:hypothetical protein